MWGFSGSDWYSVSLLQYETTIKIRYCSFLFKRANLQIHQLINQIISQLIVSPTVYSFIYAALCLYFTACKLLFF